MSDRTKHFSIAYFGDPPDFFSNCRPTKYFRQISVTKKHGEDITIGEVKKAAGEAIKLKHRSLIIFGLFLGGDLGLPRILCPDQGIVTEDHSQFFFQLASFDAELETTIICEDEKATELIYWELKNIWGFYGFLQTALTECTLSLFSVYKKVSQMHPLSLSHIRKLLHKIRINSSYFRQYYYNVRHIELKLPCTDMEVESATTAHSPERITVSYCNTRDLFAIEEPLPPHLYRGRPLLMCGDLKQSTLDRTINVSVAVNTEKLVICDGLGKCELLSLDWALIKLLMIEKKPNKRFIFEFLVCSRSDEWRRITIQTNYNEYLYSISMYIISQNCRKSDSTGALPTSIVTKSIEEFNNPLFNSCPVDHSKLAHVVFEIIPINCDSTSTLTERDVPIHSRLLSDMELTSANSAESTCLEAEDDNLKCDVVPPTRASSIFLRPLHLLLPPNTTANAEKTINVKCVSTREVPVIQVSNGALATDNLKTEDRQGEGLYLINGEESSDTGMERSAKHEKLPKKMKNFSQGLSHKMTAFPNSCTRSRPDSSPKLRPNHVSPNITWSRTSTTSLKSGKSQFLPSQRIGGSKSSTGLKCKERKYVIPKSSKSAPTTSSRSRTSASLASAKTTV